MGRIFALNLTGLLPTQQDDVSTANTVYTRFGSGIKNEYMEKQLSVSPYTHQWTWGLWTNRTSMVSWVDINQKFIDL